MHTQIINDNNFFIKTFLSNSFVFRIHHGIRIVIYINCNTVSRIGYIGTHRKLGQLSCVSVHMIDMCLKYRTFTEIAVLHNPRSDGFFLKRSVCLCTGNHRYAIRADRKSCLHKAVILPDINA